MARMKKGTKIGWLDINQQQIAIGDKVRDTVSGKVYEINSYGQAFRMDIGAIKLKTLAGHIVVVDDNAEDIDLNANEKREGTEEEKAAVSPAGTIIDLAGMPSHDPEEEGGEVEASTLTDYSDEDLVAELRSRGVRVKAQKTVVVEL